MNAFIKWSREPQFEERIPTDEVTSDLTQQAAQQSISGIRESLTYRAEKAESQRSSLSRKAQTRDLKFALQLLEKASTGVDNLSEKANRVESEKNRSVEELTRYKNMEQQWRENLESAKRRFDDMQAEILMLSEKLIDETARATAVEVKLIELQHKFKEVEDRNSELENDYFVLHDTISEIFGSGSQTYATLSSHLPIE